ncbi:MAG TPA: carbamoyltransferase C-terminal domain-containing protein [Patescibacteria group bacterium]
MLYYPNPQRKNIVGFNTGHHGGCAIISKDGVVAMQEERLNRKKYSDGYLYSFFYCLETLGLKASDIDLFVSSSYHQNLSPDFQGKFKELGIDNDKFITVDHHLSHAYSAYFLSPFDEAIVVVIDGLGNNGDTESYYIAKGSKITKVGGNDKNRPAYKGIGRAYETFTNYCGWSAQEAGKTMGLSAYGKEVCPDVELYKINDKNEIESFIEGKYHMGAMNFVKNNSINFGEPFSEFENMDAAYFVQDRSEKVIIQLVKNLYEKHGIKNICLAGGVFLNGIINKKILEETQIENVFVPPCCDDTGQPFGNALYGHHAHFGMEKEFNLKNAYLGRKYSDDEIFDVLEKKQVIYSLPYKTKSTDIEFVKIENIAQKTAELLSEGKVVAWFQGESEIGPRALGHRSILSSPVSTQLRDFINKDIKHREGWRPFAPAILEEKVNQYFDIEIPSPYMLMVAKAKKEAYDKIPAVIHVDGTARVQTVNKTDNGNFYDLLLEFENKTGIPVLLNTSLNDAGEPVVENPRDALNMFCRSKLDYLIIDNYLVWRK